LIGFMAMKRMLALAIIAFQVACAMAGETTSPQQDPVLLEIATPFQQGDEAFLFPTLAAGEKATLGFTYQNSDGNRYVTGIGSLPAVEPVDIGLSGRPIWIVAAATEEGSIWAVLLEDGRIETFHVIDRRIEPAEATPANLPLEMPPLLVRSDTSNMLFTAPFDDSSNLTHPVMLSLQTGKAAYLSNSGELILWDGSGRQRLALNAPMDARLLVDESSRILLLVGATMQYRHGVLGDQIEASGVALVETSPANRVIQEIGIDPPSVIEGIAPIWADLTGDGRREIIVTISNADVGAQITIYNEEGDLLAVGPAIGTGFRWRHQLAVAPFGPGGELELAVVKTPHIGGIVEFYRLSSDGLDIVAQLPGYRSHVIGSRNLDGGLAGDFDGDGAVELLVPNQAQDFLAAVRRTFTGAEEVWRVAIGGQLATNIAAVTLRDGTVIVGAGTVEDSLRLWIPEIPG
jgi:hypothetical protein